MSISPYYYSKSVNSFIKESDESILGTLAQHHAFQLEQTQKEAWMQQISILKRELKEFDDAELAFEYTIPRINSRIDNVLLYKNLVFLIEFKVGKNTYTSNDKAQIEDYALNIKNFHRQSRDCTIIPILVATNAKNSVDNSLSQEDPYLKDQIHRVIFCNKSNLGEAIRTVSTQISATPFDKKAWLHSIYMPSPTIIEAAQALYQNHRVIDITRNDAGAVNLKATTQAILDIIEKSRNNHQRSICFITGVPGAGKTLAGLNIANEQHAKDDSTHAVFLSGNGPLVKVLQEALLRDEKKRLKGRDKKSQRESASSRVKAFIQIIHQFRDDAIKNKNNEPAENIIIFDEAQRAWDKDALCTFMSKKKNLPNYNISEPEFLLEVMERKKDWCVLVCLIGGGQEINKGEAGLQEWFHALQSSHKNWKVYISNNITDTEYLSSCSLDQLLQGLSYEFNSHLHLSVSLRSFRSEKVSCFVKNLLDNQAEEAKQLYRQFKDHYQIYLTRDINDAKEWVKRQAHGTERYGIVAYSGAQRLRAHGIWTKNQLDVAKWFLNDHEDIHSSYMMEEAATEFDIQGLELDWVVMAWDANMRYEGNQWAYYDFKGNKWTRPNPKRAMYIKNAHRVLLTRARQGLVIYVPYGSTEDQTRNPQWYDDIYNYFKEILED